MAVRSNTIKIDTLQSIELSEGVEIQLRVAGVFSRSLAFLLDLIFTTVAGSTLAILTLFGGQIIGSNYASAIYGLLMFFLTWGYFYFMESGHRGATFGKRIVGLRVVTDSGGVAQRGQIFTRNLFRIVELLMLPLVGLCTCMMTRKFQRAGDLVAGTVVVYSKTETQLSMALSSTENLQPPAWKLKREEQAAIVSFRERGGLWSESRQEELASHAKGLLGEGEKQPVQRLVGMADWLSEKR